MSGARGGAIVRPRGLTLLALGLLPMMLLAWGGAAPAAAQDADEWDYVVDVEGTLLRVHCPTQRLEEVGRVAAAGEDGEEDRPVLCDLAATPDGHLYGISTTHLYLINLEDPQDSRCLGAHGLDRPYGMGAVGGMLVANTAGGDVLVIDQETADEDPAGWARLGAMGGGWAASGDVGLAGEDLLSSVKDAERREHLVVLDGETGAARLVGPVVDERGEDVADLFGLVEREDLLYGFTSDGRVLEVDPGSGRCRTLARTGRRFWGAAAYVRS